MESSWLEHYSNIMGTGFGMKCTKQSAWDLLLLVLYTQWQWEQGKPKLFVFSWGHNLQDCCFGNLEGIWYVSHECRAAWKTWATWNRAYHLVGSQGVRVCNVGALFCIPGQTDSSRQAAAAGHVLRDGAGFRGSLSTQGAQGVPLWANSYLQWTP